MGSQAGPAPGGVEGLLRGGRRRPHRLLGAAEGAALHVLLRAVPVQAEKLEVGHYGGVDGPRGDVGGGGGALDAARARRRREVERLSAPVQSRLAEARRQAADEVVLLARLALLGLLRFLLEEERREALGERPRGARALVHVRRRVGRLQRFRGVRLRLYGIRFPLNADSGEDAFFLVGVVGRLVVWGVVFADLKNNKKIFIYFNSNKKHKFF